MKLFTAPEVLCELFLDNDSDNKGLEISSCYNDINVSIDLDLEISSIFRSDVENLNLAFTLPEGWTNRSRFRAIIAPNLLRQYLYGRKVLI